MSTLVAIAYDDEPTAQRARATLNRLQRERLISLEDAVIAVNEGDKIRLDQAVSLTGAGAMGGAAWGGLIGLLFLMPVAGMVIGAAGGALSGKLSDIGLEDRFVKEIGRELEPGHAALFLLIREVTADKVVAEMKQFGGTVLRSNLSNDAEKQLQEALSGSGEGTTA